MNDVRDDQMSCDDCASHLAEYLDGDASVVVRERVDRHAAACDNCGQLLFELQILLEQAASLPPLVPSRDLWAGIAARIDTPVVSIDAAHGGHAAPAVSRRWSARWAAVAALILVTAGVTNLLTRSLMTPAVVQVASSQAATGGTAAVPSLDTAVTGGTATTSSSRDAVSSGGAAPRRATQLVSSGASPAPRAGRVGATGPRPAARLASASSLMRETDPVYDREITALRRIVRERRASLDPATIAVLEQSVAVIDSAIAQSRAALARDPASAFLATQLNHSLEKKVELLRTAALLPART